MGVQALTFTQIFGLGTTVVYTIALRVGIAMLVLAIIEYLYQRWRIEKELKMSKQEVKEEMRRMEGDPKIKQRRRQIAVQQLKKRLKKDVPTADVVVTNPTEFAIALKYDAGTMHAPRVVAKGQGLIAQHIREIAIAAGVPILERKPLARALYKLVEVGQEIPEEFYSAVAEILAYVYELSGKMRQPGTAFEAVAAR
jgi:flagellar biosynthesis protein FlhB